MSSAPQTESTYRAFEEATENGIVHPDLRTLFALWNARRDTRAMAAPGSITPRDMKNFLSHVQLYDVVDSGKDFRARVIGTQFSRAFGYDATGQLASEHPNVARRARFLRALSNVYSTRKPLHLVTDQTEVERGLRHELEALWLPLGRESEVEQVLGLSILKSFQLKG